jgi:hypothetical protein
LTLSSKFIYSVVSHNKKNKKEPMELKFEFTTKGRGAVIVTVTVDDSFKIRALSCSNSVMDQVFEDPNKLKLMQDHVDSECAGTPGSNFITLNVRKRRVEFKVTRIS